MPPSRQSYKRLYLRPLLRSRFANHRRRRFENHQVDRDFPAVKNRRKTEVGERENWGGDVQRSNNTNSAGKFNLPEVQGVAQPRAKVVKSPFEQPTHNSFIGPDIRTDCIQILATDKRPYVCGAGGRGVCVGGQHPPTPHHGVTRDKPYVEASSTKSKNQQGTRSEVDGAERTPVEVLENKIGDDYAVPGVRQGGERTGVPLIEPRQNSNQFSLVPIRCSVSEMEHMLVQSQDGVCSRMRPGSDPHSSVGDNRDTGHTFIEGRGNPDHGGDSAGGGRTTTRTEDATALPPEEWSTLLARPEYAPRSVDGHHSPHVSRIIAGLPPVDAMTRERERIIYKIMGSGTGSDRLSGDVEVFEDCDFFESGIPAAASPLNS